MQYINLTKTLEMENKILDLLLISMDDQIETIDDSEGVKIVGNITIGGKLKTLEGEREINDNISLDIFLTQEEIVERNSLNISINDFNYNIEENKLLLNISLKIDGLKEIETNFLAQEDNEIIQDEVDEEEEKIEKEDKKVYIDVDIDVNDRELILDEEENIIIDNHEDEKIARGEELEEKETILEEIKPEKKSLLRSVFANRKINGEVSWKLHCVKGENSYEEIAKKYNVSLNKLVSINNNERLEEGKLIFLPLE